jgi:septum formation inhibitor-activating ATPase MinD
MAQVLVVTSGKGGVGKTTSTAALGAALAHDGAKVVVIDFDVGLRNLDLVLGAERRVSEDAGCVIHLQTGHSSSGRFWRVPGSAAKQAGAAARLEE